MFDGSPDRLFQPQANFSMRLDANPAIFTSQLHSQADGGSLRRQFCPPPIPTKTNFSPIAIVVPSTKPQIAPAVDATSQSDRAVRVIRARLACAHGADECVASFSPQACSVWAESVPAFDAVASIHYRYTTR